MYNIASSLQSFHCLAVWNILRWDAIDGNDDVIHPVGD